jgi:hypothetical protein
MVWKISFLLKSYTTPPSDEEVWGRLELATFPGVRLTHNDPLPRCSLPGRRPPPGGRRPGSACPPPPASLTSNSKLLFYLGPGWILFLSLPCYMTDRCCIQKGTRISLVHAQKRRLGCCLSESEDAGDPCKNINHQTSGSHKNYLQWWTSNPLQGK